MLRAVEWALTAQTQHFSFPNQKSHQSDYTGDILPEWRLTGASPDNQGGVTRDWALTRTP